MTRESQDFFRPEADWARAPFGKNTASSRPRNPGPEGAASFFSPSRPAWKMSLASRSRTAFSSAGATSNYAVHSASVQSLSEM